MAKHQPDKGAGEFHARESACAELHRSTAGRNLPAMSAQDFFTAPSLTTEPPRMARIDADRSGTSAFIGVIRGKTFGPR